MPYQNELISIKIRDIYENIVLQSECFGVTQTLTFPPILQVLIIFVLYSKTLSIVINS